MILQFLKPVHCHAVHCFSGCWSLLFWYWLLFLRVPWPHLEPINFVGSCAKLAQAQMLLLWS